MKQLLLGIVAFFSAFIVANAQDIVQQTIVVDAHQTSQGYYTVEQWKDTLVFNDLRFGQINGWQNPNSRFAFHYYLSHPEDNDLIVQRGRMAGVNMGSARVMWERILGHR